MGPPTARLNAWLMPSSSLAREHLCSCHIILVVATEKNGTTDEDLATWREDHWITVHLWHSSQTEVKAWQRMTHGPNCSLQQHLLRVMRTSCHATMSCASFACFSACADKHKIHWSQDECLSQI